MASETTCPRCGRARAADLEAWKATFPPRYGGEHGGPCPPDPGPAASCGAALNLDAKDLDWWLEWTNAVQSDCDRATIARLERELTEAKGRVARLEAGVRAAGVCVNGPGPCSHCYGSGLEDWARALLATSPTG